MAAVIRSASESRTIGISAPLTIDKRVASRRRRAGRRLEDLDGAYNDGARPSALRPAHAIVFYGTASWLVVSAAVGSYEIIRAIWSII